MKPVRLKDVEALFHAALEQEESERDAFVERACRGNEALLREVRSLLGHDEPAEDFIERPAIEAVMGGVSSAEAEDPPSMIGQRLGRYRIAEKLGEGGMGVVYRAADEHLERDVALKVLPAGTLIDEEARRRFRREALTLSRLNHAFIATVHDFDSHDGTDFLVMEYVAGETLADRLKQGPLTPDEVARVGEQISHALEEAHERHIVHRDIKPRNIALTPKHDVKVLDFGIAKLLRQSPDSAESEAETMTEATAIAGTPPYMSPEQLRGRAIDVRTDIYALGAVLYEMATGRRAFSGSVAARLREQALEHTPPPPRQLNPTLPVELERTITRCLEKDPERRYQTAHELRLDLSHFRSRSFLAQIGAGTLLRQPRFAVPAIALLATLLAGGAWLWVRSARVEWVRQTALPEIARLVQEEGDYVAAFRLATEAERYVPDDATLLGHWSEIARFISLDTRPPGATVSFQEYADPGSDWTSLGQTPLKVVRIPRGFFRWRIEREGYEAVRTATAGVAFPHADERGVIDLEPRASRPEGMVRLPAASVKLEVPRLFHLEPVDLGDYWIDEHEVSNREFMEFVRAGGYGERDLWVEGLAALDPQPAWEEAIDQLRDATGRPGPATWQLGGYATGLDDHPVGGVSWLEAVTYCRFVGKELPTIYHWYRAASPDLDAQLVPLSNFSGRGTTARGETAALGPFGSRDMAGNVKEWAWNSFGDARYLLGGAWNEPTYMFRNVDVRSPLERRPTFGLRCMKPVHPDPVLEASRDAIREAAPRAEASRVTEAEYRIYERLYTYDEAPLSTSIDSVEDGEVFRKERVSIAAAYGSERLPLLLFLPSQVEPPYPTVVYFPGSWALSALSSDVLSTGTVDFLVRSGRAVCLPIYKGTYERAVDLKDDDPNPSGAYRDLVIMQSKDLGRAIDYLETRSDLDLEHLAYYGISWGAGMGALFPAVEPRLRLAVLDAGGLWPTAALPEADIRTFAPRVEIPVLMVNGRYDPAFPLDSSQRPLFRMLGSTEPDKQHVILEQGHWETSNERIRVTLDWLDEKQGAGNR